MLWTDKIFITVDDLTRIDSETQKVADAEEITLTGDNGQIRAGVEEAANELQKLIIAFGGYLNSGDLTANHLAAVLNVGIGNSVRMKAGLNQICVSGDTSTSWNWIKQWAIFWTLRVFYRNAFARTVNDRYEKKMNIYKDEIIRRVQPTLFALGAPIVLRPLYAPAAYFTRNAGSWDSSNVELVAGAGTLDNTHSCDVVVTFVDMSQANLYNSPTNVGNAESELSDRITQVMNTGEVLEVDITSLNPPTGAQDPSQILVVVISPLKATHWNIYVSATPGGTLYLQNSQPIPIATKTYTFTGNPVFSGYMSGIGQYPDRRLSLVPMRQRA
jgi:hypothetical protein